MRKWERKEKRKGREKNKKGEETKGEGGRK